MRQCYGTRYMTKALRQRGIDCGHCRARALMRLAGIQVRRNKGFVNTTDSKHDMPVAAKLLKRKFDVAEPNQA